ncbi:hypothetical protein PMALA_036400, partial [Plasmodium malariae]
MDNCFTRDYSGLGSGAGQYLRKPKFIQTRSQILSRLSSLEKETDKAKFRNECLDLVNFLIKKKDDPPAFTEQKRWVPVLRNYFKHKFDKITQHGGCPMIFDPKEKNILELKYDALDFCETNNVYETKLRNFKKGGSRTYNCNSDSNCIKHCTEYKNWFTRNKQHFEEKRHLISESCTFKSSSSEFPTKQCNIMNPRMLNNIPKCLYTKPQKHSEHAPKEQKEISRSKLYQVNAKDSPVSQDQSPSQVERPPDGQHSPSEHQQRSLPEGPRSDQSKLQTTAEDRNPTSLSNLDTDTQDSITQKPDSITHPSSPQEILSSSIAQSPGSQELEARSYIDTIPAATEVLHLKAPPTTPVDSKIQ